MTGYGMTRLGTFTPVTLPKDALISARVLTLNFGVTLFYDQNLRGGRGRGAEAAALRPVGARRLAREGFVQLAQRL
jgi:hypothetical protein